jgi:hypothetical protein
MTRKQKVTALKALARKYPTGGPFGVWKNPLDPKSRGMRWTGDDYEMFERFQKEQAQRKTRKNRWWSFGF